MKGRVSGATILGPAQSVEDQVGSTDRCRDPADHSEIGLNIVSNGRPRDPRSDQETGQPPEQAAQDILTRLERPRRLFSQQR